MGIQVRVASRYTFISRSCNVPRRRFKPEEIVAKLRQVDVLVSQGQTCMPTATGLLDWHEQHNASHLKD
jgi:hypothetical protein